MNRQEYIHQLAYRLRKLPKEDYDRAMNYFNEYFEEAGMDNEQVAIEDLGTPQQAADQIIQDLAKENLAQTNTPKTMKRGLSTVWIVILAIFASPVALPLALALILVLLSILLCAFILVTSIAVTALCLLAVGIVGIFGGVYLLFTAFTSGLATVGISLITLGIGILLSIATVKVARGTGNALIKMMKSLIKGGKTHAKNK